MAKAARGKRGKTKPDTAANLGFEAKHAEFQTHRAEGADPEDRDEYRAASIFWVPKKTRVKAIDFETSGHNADAQT